MRTFKLISVASVASVALACGDSGGRESDSASQGPTSASVTDTTAAGTDNSDSNSDSTVPTSSDSESNSNSNSESNSATTPTTGTAATTTDAVTTGQVSISATDTDTATDTGTDTDTNSESDSETDEPCPPSGGIDFSYLWIANTDQGSVSKIDAYTATEVARYYTDPVQSGAASPSRTSVSLDGRFVVVSNRDTGSITKIAANEADCIDRNGDGIIQTSPDKDTLLPYADEECIIWTTTLTINNHQWGPRATSFSLPDWNVETCAFENEKIWVGYMVGVGQAQMGRLNSETGAVEATTDLIDFPLHGNYSPYGAAIDPDGNVWTTGVFSPAAIRVDATTLAVQRWNSPDADSHYGITVAASGKVWFANYNGHGGVSYFDPALEQWKVIPGTTGNLWRSLAADDQGNIWVSNNGGSYGCGLLQIDSNSEIVTNFHNFAQCGTPVGVGLDGMGKVWMIDYSGWTWRMDPDTLEKFQLPVANVHYTYSDFTGSGLAGVVPG